MAGACRGRQGGENAIRYGDIGFRVGFKFMRSQNCIVKSLPLPDSGSGTLKSQELTCVALWPGTSLCSLGKEGQVLVGVAKGLTGVSAEARARAGSVRVYGCELVAEMLSSCIDGTWDGLEKKVESGWWRISNLALMWILVLFIEEKPKLKRIGLKGMGQ